MCLPILMYIEGNFFNCSIVFLITVFSLSHGKRFLFHFPPYKVCTGVCLWGGGWKSMPDKFLFLFVYFFLLLIKINLIYNLMLHFWYSFRKWKIGMARMGITLNGYQIQGEICQLTKWSGKCFMLRVRDQLGDSL